MKRPRALLFACLAGAFAVGASCDDGSAEEEAPANVDENRSAGSEQRIDVTSLGVPAVGDMADRDRDRYGRLVNDLLSPCGDPTSLARCAKEGGECTACGPAARYVARLVDEGFETGAIEKMYRARYTDEAQKDIDVQGSPVRGSPMAPVTIVEFSDFECPFCGGASPVLERVVDESEGKVRLVFKHYPLDSHPHARAAAKAAIAAGKQGKFWEMHDELFENQAALERSDLDEYARELGLDMEQFEEDMESDATEERISKDKTMGSKAGVRGTPAIFVNGRLYDEPLRNLPVYIEEELDR
ncbi:MAG: DsbA family protein [Myxococcota bacterium]